MPTTPENHPDSLHKGGRPHQKPKIIFEAVHDTINMTRPKVDAINAEAQANLDDPADTGTKAPVWEGVPGSTAGTGAGPSIGQNYPVTR